MRKSLIVFVFLSSCLFSTQSVSAQTHAVSDKSVAATKKIGTYNGYDVMLEGTKPVAVKQGKKYKPESTHQKAKAAATVGARRIDYKGSVYYRFTILGFCFYAVHDLDEGSWYVIEC